MTERQSLESYNGLFIPPNNAPVKENLGEAVEAVEAVVMDLVPVVLAIVAPTEM